MKVLLLAAGGRTGSDFFHSILDGHSQILQFPGYMKIEKEFERDIFSKLIKEFKKLTLIVVTHRNTDSKFFDKIINMKNKKIIIKSKKK